MTKPDGYERAPADAVERQYSSAAERRLSSQTAGSPAASLNAKYVLDALRGAIKWHTEQGRPHSASVDADAVTVIEHRGALNAELAAELRDMALLFRSALLCTSVEIARQARPFLDRADALVKRASTEG